jgi:urease gamma subunit/cbb3-type cytochrome oxidase subunit 3
VSAAKAKLISYVLLFVLIAGSIAADIVWTSLNRAPAFWDPADYLALSQKYQVYLKSQGLDGLWWAYGNLEVSRAPLLPILALPFYMALGNHQASAMCVNYLAIIVLCVSIYGIGRLIRDRWLGVIAAYLTMMTPALFGLSREFFVEFPMAAAIAATLYFCLRAHKMRHYASVPLIAVSVAATMLFKVNFPIFIALPIVLILLWRAYHVVIRDSATHLSAIITTLVGIMIAIAVAATWYVPNLKYWLSFMMQNVVGARGAVYGASTADYLTEEARSAFLSYHVLALLLLLLLSIVVWIVRRQGKAAVEYTDMRGMGIVAVAAWFAGALYVCLSAADKDVRILFPALPALAVLLAMGYRAMASGWRAVPATVLLLFPLVAFMNFSFRGQYDATVEFRPDKAKVDIWSGDYFLGLKPLTPYVHAPNSRDWKGKEIVEFVERNISEVLARSIARNPESGVGVCVVPNSPYLQPNWLNYVSYKAYVEGGTKYQMGFADPGYHKAALTPAECEQKIISEGRKATPEAVLRELLKEYAESIIDSKSQFILVTEGGWQGPSLYDYRVEGKVIFTHDDVMEKITEILPKVKLFERIPGEIILPDGSHVIVYRNRYAGSAVPKEKLDDFVNLFAGAGKLSP